jgi:hypothetical protein
MAHNTEVGESRGGGRYTRPTNLLTVRKRRSSPTNNIFVPPAWHLPHGCHVSAGGYAVASIPPEGRYSTTTSSSAGKRYRRRCMIGPSGRRHVPFCFPFFRASGCSSSAATTASTTVGTMCPTIGRTGGAATSTPCFGSTATAPNTACRLQYAVGPRLRPRR